MFIGASPSLKSLRCLQDGVCYPPIPLAVWGKEGESEAPRFGKGEKDEGGRKERTGAASLAERKRSTQEIYLPELRSRNRVKSRTTNYQPTTNVHPPHYAHRSRYFNVPLEMVVCYTTPDRRISHVLRCIARNY